MNKIVAIISLVMITNTCVYSQQCMTRTAFVGFYSKTSFEDILAENNQVYSVIDLGSKKIAFAGLLKGFIFKKELMQEHFNENYVESDKYPKVTFTGIFTGDVSPAANGVYKILVKGNLTLHNVTRAISVPATLEVKDGKLLGNAEFKVKPEDFNISIPSVVRDKIATQMDVHVKIDCNIAK